jgi:hypothetical protein
MSAVGSRGDRDLAPVGAEGPFGELERAVADGALCDDVVARSQKFVAAIVIDLVTYGQSTHGNR